jgi:hypothetical protein
LLASAAVALGASFAGFCRSELMGVARGVCCTATFCSDLALAVAVHGRKAAARSTLVVPALVLALVLVALIAVCHFDLL